MEDFLVLAASCRSIARSITQAGYKCRGIDLFADWDTEKICAVMQVADWDAAFTEAAKSPPGMQYVWGAGIDNALLMHRASREHVQMFSGERCCAIVGPPLRRCRDPFFVAEKLNQCGMPPLALRRRKPEQGRWIEKPIFSGGGERVHLHPPEGITVLAGEDCEAQGWSFYQEFKPGAVYGATFIAGKQCCEFVGVCRQFHRAVGGFQFLYSASIGPIEISELLKTKMNRMGEVVAEACGLRGWFGIDFIVNQNQVWLIEINPRYTASMEILERVSGCSLFAQHLSAFQSGVIDTALEVPQSDGSMLGKQYVFWQQPKPLRMTAGLQRWLIDFADSDGFVTDIPRIDMQIEPMAPLCTVWASAVDLEVVQQRLKKSKETILQTLKQKNTS